MQKDYWHKQLTTEPLYSDMLWSKPENKKMAGKLLIIGGNAHGFVDPAEAFRASQAAGIGTAHMVLPDSLTQFVGRHVSGSLTPSTPSGSFALEGLATILTEASLADGTIVAGSLGRNSETAVLLERLASKYTGQFTITKDALDYFINNSKPLLDRPNTTIIASFAQLQKIATNSKYSQAFSFNMDVIRLVEALHGFSMAHCANIITKHLDNFLVAVNGQVSSTKVPENREIWRVETAAYAAVWLLQNPAKPLEALTTAIYEVTKKNLA